MSTRRKWVGNHVDTAVLLDSAQTSVTATNPLSRHGCDASFKAINDSYPIDRRQYRLEHH